MASLTRMIWGTLLLLSVSIWESFSVFFFWFWNIIDFSACCNRTSQCQTGGAGRDAEGGSRSHQFHSLPHHVWREAERWNINCKYMKIWNWLRLCTHVGLDLTVSCIQVLIQRKPFSMPLRCLTQREKESWGRTSEWLDSCKSLHSAVF